MALATRLAAAGITGVLAVGATACDRNTATPTAPPAPAASPARDAAAPAPVPPAEAPAPTGAADSGETAGATPAKQPNQRIPLLDGEDPKGPGPAIALRFLRALQDGDHVDAARELFRVGRGYLAGHDQRVLDRVMTDVARNARLADAGECTRADRLNAEAAVVRCGRRNIVVHVTDRLLRGVRISTVHPDGDMYHGPHTHAFTTVDPF